jgi:hypothetical protein
MEEFARGIAWVASFIVLGLIGLLASTAFTGGEHAGRHRTAPLDRAKAPQER